MPELGRFPATGVPSLQRLLALKGGRFDLTTGMVRQAVTAVGSGIKGDNFSFLSLNTGTTANSSARIPHYTPRVYGDTLGDQFDFDKEMWVVFNFWRDTANVQGIFRLHLAGTHGALALATKGFGISIANLDLSGVGYNSALSTVSLMTLTNLLKYKIAIHHRPAVPKLDFYVDDVLKGSITAAAGVPTGLGSTNDYLALGVVNGDVGGTDFKSRTTPLFIWRAR